jgi:hypothetical protein
MNVHVLKLEGKKPLQKILVLIDGEKVVCMSALHSILEEAFEAMSLVQEKVIGM